MRSCRKNRAFSTIEVMVAVSIVIILAAIVLGVGRRLKTQADEKLAKSTIQILVTAIGQYHQFWDEFPAVTDPCGLPAEHSEELYNRLYKTPNSKSEHSEELYNRLYKTPNSKSLCEQIQTTQISSTDSDSELEFLDPWGQPLDYIYSAGDSFPEVISGGPDGDPCTQADNISSRNIEF